MTGKIEKLTPYNPAEDLTSDEAIAHFMAGAFETGDPGFIAHALGIVCSDGNFSVRLRKVYTAARP